MGILNLISKTPKITPTLEMTKLGIVVVPLICAMPSTGNTAEKCIAHSIDKVGHCHGRRFAKKITDREIYGTPNRTVAPPRGIDPNLLATQITHRLAKGSLTKINGTLDVWVLSIEGYPYANAPSSMHLLQIQPAIVNDSPQSGEDHSRKAVVKVLATIETETIPLESHLQETKHEELMSCINPEELGSNASDHGASGPYTSLGGPWRTMQLSSTHQVFVGSLDRSEGYAGGGGSFSGEVLFEKRDKQLVPVGCYAVSRYQMFGGAWNSDGTRQHPESQARWRVLPLKKTGVDWPMIQLLAMTHNTPSATLAWDKQLNQYVVKSFTRVKPQKAH